MVLLALLSVGVGCGPTANVRAGRPADVDALRDDAFRAGVRAALSAYADNYLDNDFPYYNWHAPVVQQTWIPPRIANGVFIPGHTDYVTITPGAYKREFAAPLSSQRELSDQRPYVRDHAVGWADEEPRIGRTPSARMEHQAASSPGSGTESGISTSARPWSELPPPSARWLGR